MFDNNNRKRIDVMVVEELGTIKNGSKPIRVRVVSWDNGEPKIDIRTWYFDSDGEEKPGKGISLTLEQAKDVAGFISDYLLKLDNEIDMRGCKRDEDKYN